MKHFYPVLCFFLFCYYPSSTSGQRKVTVTGDTCLGNYLTAHAVNGFPKVIRWIKADSIVAFARGAWSVESVIVAGGNGEGFDSAHLYSPGNVFVDKARNVYVVDTRRIQRWAANATYGVTVAGGNGKGTALNQFWTATGIYVDDNRNIYVSDSYLNRVTKWAPGANTGVLVAGGNGYGSAPNQLAGPAEITMDKQGNLYIADRENERVQKWAPGATSGITVAGGNGRGSAPNQLASPYSVALDTSGNMYISDVYNYRIQKWMVGATTGVTIAGGNGQGSNADQFINPLSLRIDSAGNLYVMDNGNSRIQRWEPNASYGITVAGGYGFGNSSKQLGSIWGIAIDRFSAVYACEIGFARVKRFSMSSLPDSNYSPVTPARYKASVTFGNGGVTQSAVLRVAAKPTLPDVIRGLVFINPGQTNLTYWVQNASPDLYYNWSVPPEVVITSGDNTSTIKVNWGSQQGQMSVFASNTCGVSPSRKKNIYFNSPPPPLVLKNSTIQKAGIFPNPAFNTAQVAFTAGNSEKYNMELVDGLGRVLERRVLFSVPGQNRVSLDVSKYAKGAYFIRLANSSKSKQTFKLNKK